MVRLARLDHQQFAESTLDVRKRHGAAVKAHVQAVVVLARLAKPAVPTGPGRRNRDAVAAREPRHCDAHRFDGARDFVPQRHGLLDAHRAKATVLLVVQVRSADTTKGDAHQRLIGRQRTRGRVIFDAQIASVVANEGSHGGSFKC